MFGDQDPAHTARAEGMERPYLDRLESIAAEMELIANQIENFIARCRGSADGKAGPSIAPVASGHFGQIDRIVQNMARADKAARELQTIG